MSRPSGCGRSIFATTPKVAAVSPHAINHGIRQIRGQHVRLQQFGISAMRPLLGARTLLLKRFAERQRRSRKRPDVRGICVALHIRAHARNHHILQVFATLQPPSCRSSRVRLNRRPYGANFPKPSRRKCIVCKIRQPPGHRLRMQTRIRFAPTMNNPVAHVILRQLQAFVVQLRQNRCRRHNLFLMLH